jgi:hypothetical protein
VVSLLHSPMRDFLATLAYENEKWQGSYQNSPKFIVPRQRGDTLRVHKDSRACGERGGSLVVLQRRET